MRRRRAVIATGAVLLAIAAALLWRSCTGGPRHRGRIARDAISSTRVDLAAFRAHIARRRASAHLLQERHARERRVAPAGGTRRALGMGLSYPRCTVGPADLCATIADAVDDCGDGDGQACLAVGQFLEDEPPRPLIVRLVFHRACEYGEAEACAREAAYKSNEAVTDCAADLMVCAWRAYRHRDRALLDQACELGVADACLTFYDLGDDPPARERARFERACQLGEPFACSLLAYRLSPLCPVRCAADEDCDFDCWPPDPAAAIAAATIACDVGFTDVCSELPR